MDNAHPRLRELRYTLYRIFRNPSAIIGFTLLLFFVGVAVLAPVLAPPQYAHSPYQMPHKGFSPTPKAPSEKAIFGTTSGAAVGLMRRNLIGFIPTPINKV